MPPSPSLSPHHPTDKPPQVHVRPPVPPTLLPSNPPAPLRTCAPVTIRGGTGSQPQIDALPDIFVANIPPASDCTTGTAGDRVVLNIPNPGIHGRILQPPGEPAYKPPNYCANIPPKNQPPVFIQNDPRTVQTQGMGMPSSSSTTSEEESTTYTALTTSTHTRTVTQSMDFTMVTTTMTVVTTTPVPTGTVSCSTEGELMCFGEGYFGICSFGEATVQEVAPGTKCVGGRIVGVDDEMGERGRGRWGGRW